MKTRTLLGLYIGGMIAALFGISQYFPSYWYRPTNLAILLGTVTAMIQVFNVYVLFVPIAAIFAMIAFMMRPEKFFPRSAILLLPLWPAILLTLWGAYCWRYYEHDIMGLKMGIWTRDVFTQLNFIYLLHFFVLFLAVFFSKTWHNARTFGFCILSIEF